MYLPGAWEREFEQYKKDELKYNENLYDNISLSQYKVIQEYFRWMSKNRVRELTKDTSLEVLPEKAVELASRFGNVDDWEYDGCVDTGYFGGGECELGHALRYEHYAYSASTGQTIIFGVKCVSDFFGIEPKKLRSINKVQAEILEEVKLIIFILETGKYKEYIGRYYKDLLDVVKALKPNVNKYFGADWNEQMAEFISVGLPLTPSMIDRFNWVKQRYYKRAIKLLKIKDLFNDGVILDALDRIGFEPDTYAAKSVLSWMRDEKEAIRNKLDTDNKRKVIVILGSKTEDLYRDFMNRGKDLKIYIRNAESGNLTPDIREKITKLDSAINGRYDTDSEYFITNAKDINNAIDWATNGGFKEIESEVEVPEIHEVIRYIDENCPRPTSYWILRIALETIEKYRRYNIQLSTKQISMLHDAYYMIREMKHSGRDKDTKDTEDKNNYRDIANQRYLDNLYKIELIEKYAEDNKGDTKKLRRIKILGFASRVIDTVRTNERLSEKQLIYIDEAFNEINKVINEGKENNIINNKENVVKEEADIEELDIGEPIREPKIDASRIQSGKGNMIIRVPTTSEMSGMLGQGVLEECVDNE